MLDARELIRYATLAASSHNTQPWKFRIQQDSITILPDFSRRCPVVDPDDSHLFKSLGCAAENLVHAAAAQGFSADVRFNTEQESIVIFLNRDASTRATDLYRAITARQCVRTAYDGTPLGAPELEMLERAGEGRNVRTIMLFSTAQKDTVIDYVTRGNVAQLTDRAFRDELVAWIRFNPGVAMRTGDGLSGRTFERFALQATALNVRTAFINQPIEVRSLRPQFESWLNLDREHALLMVRFGHGPTAPFSMRRPIDDVIIAD